MVHPKSIPKYKYLSALGVSVFVNAVRFGLTCMSKIDGVGTLSVASCLSFYFLQSKYTFVVRQTFGLTGCLTIGFCREVTGHLLCATGHL